jgi:hypothetical protein
MISNRIMELLSTAIGKQPEFCTAYHESSKSKRTLIFTVKVVLLYSVLVYILLYRIFSNIHPSTQLSINKSMKYILIILYDIFRPLATSHHCLP